VPPTDPATAREAADTTGTFSGGLTSVGVYLDETPTMPRRNREAAPSSDQELIGMNLPSRIGTGPRRPGLTARAPSRNISRRTPLAATCAVEQTQTA
jgi:hypothetical protein